MKHPYSMKKQFEKGEIIVTKGDVSDDVYIVRSGMAEIVDINATGEETLVSIIDQGQVFGELGFILEQPRTITVRAIEKTEVEVFDTRSFSYLYDTELGQLIKPIMQKMAERLRNSELMISELEAKVKSTPLDYGVSDEFERQQTTTNDDVGVVIYMIAETEEAVNAMGGVKKIEINSFPFDVGRFSRRRSDDMFHLNNFYLTDFPPYSISRSHFSIVKKKDGFYFRDRGSVLGSMVNGEQVGGGHFKAKKAKFVKGENTVTLGAVGKNLTFTFKLQ